MLVCHFLCIFASGSINLIFMKTQFKLLLIMAVALLSASCDNAEAEYKYETYVDGIYTVDAKAKSVLRPEFADTFYVVENIDKYGLEPGTRARMVLHFYHDAYSGQRPLWNIVQLVDVIPVRAVEAMDSAALSAYGSPMQLAMLELSDRVLYPQWVWKNRQNINVRYKGLSDGADFKLMLRGVSEGRVEFDLVAKALQSGAVKSTKLLTFDLAGLENLLTPAQKSSVASKDSLETRIYMKCETASGELYDFDFIGGKIPNTFK